MNRKEFLEKLEACLEKLPSEEKRDALNYYEELFDDAGEENEQDIIEKFGSPEDIARQLLTENGIPLDYDSELLPEKSVPEPEGSSSSGGDIPLVEAIKNDRNRFLLILIILVVTFPLWIGLVAGCFGALLGIMIAIVAVMFSLCVAGAALIAVGIAMMFKVFPVGLICLGAGLIVSGIAALVVKPVVSGVLKLAVWLVNLVVNGVRGLLVKKEVV